MQNIALIIETVSVSHKGWDLALSDESGTSYRWQQIDKDRGGYSHKVLHLICTSRPEAETHLAALNPVTEEELYGEEYAGCNPEFYSFVCSLPDRPVDKVTARTYSILELGVGATLLSSDIEASMSIFDEHWEDPGAG